MRSGSGRASFLHSVDGPIYESLTPNSFGKKTIALWDFFSLDLALCFLYLGTLFSKNSSFFLSKRSSSFIDIMCKIHVKRKHPRSKNRACGHPCTPPGARRTPCARIWAHAQVTLHGLSDLVHISGCTQVILGVPGCARVTLGSWVSLHSPRRMRVPLYAPGRTGT